MGNNFIEAAANRDQNTTNYVMEKLRDTLPGEIDATETGMLIGTAVNTFAELSGFTKTIPYGRVITVAITAHNGIVINSAINVAKGDDSDKAIVTGAAGAITAIGTSAILGAVATSVAATATAGGIMAASIAAAPVLVTIGVGTLIVGASYFAGELAESISADIYDKFTTPDTQLTKYDDNILLIETTESLEKTLQEYQNIFAIQDENWDIHATIPSTSNLENFTEQIKYNSNTKEATLKTDSKTTEITAIKTILSETQANQIAINKVEFDITNTNNLTVRNALEEIPEVSILLSHILIYPDEKLDMGDSGIYTIKSGDTLSEIAEDNDMTTKEVLQLNTWLIDKGRVSFDQDKVLIETDANDLARVDHTLVGDIDAQNILKDENGGNDTLVGGNLSDELSGGIGHDTYKAGDQDTILDSDGQGRVYFEETLLTGGTPTKEDKNKYEGDGGIYTLNGGTLTFEKDGKTLTINNYNKNANDLSILLKNNEDDDDEPLPKPNDKDNKNENNSSPLILDLNNDGVTSEFIYDTNTYFDIEGDEFAQRIGWVQSSDGLLALDKNQDGIINNGSELFGNYSYLENGTTASDGFDALSRYDSNSDGVIDTNDEIYSDLKVWIDANQDGTTDRGELKTLSELGISSIDLNATQVNELEHRNHISHTSAFTQDGESKIINDVWFTQDTLDSKALYTTPVDAETDAMPDIQGSGRVKNLAESMSEDSMLKEKVSTLLDSSTTSNYDTLLQQSKDILTQWTKTTDISPDETRGEHYLLNHYYPNPTPKALYRTYAYEQDVAILEEFAGREFSMVVDGEETNDVLGTMVAKDLEDRLSHIQNSTITTLLSQKLYGDEILGSTGELDYNALITQIDTSIADLSNQADPIQEDTTQVANLLSALIHRDGLEILENFDSQELAILDDALLNNGIEYSVDSQGDISGSYGDTIEGSSEAETINSAVSGEVYGGDEYLKVA